MKLLLPIILAVVGVVGGAAIGFVMKPEPVVEETEAGGAEENAEAGAGERGPQSAGDSEYFDLASRVVAPFRRADGRSAFVTVEVTLEMAPGSVEAARTHEPKLVAAFLRVLVHFAATGAFDDHAHSAHTLDELTDELYKAADAILGEDVRATLVRNLLAAPA